MTRLPINNFHIRLLFLIALIIIPVLGLIIYTGAEQKTYAVETTHENALHTAHHLANAQNQVFESAHQTLATLARLESIRTLDSTRCTFDLTELRQQYRSYREMFVLAPSENLICSAPTLSPPLDPNIHTLFLEAIQSRSLTIGDIEVHPISGKVIVPIGYPIIDEQESLIGFIGATVDFSWLTTYSQVNHIPEEAIITIINQKGTILARTQDADKWIGQNIPETALYQAITSSSQDDLIRVKGIDNTERIYAYAIADYEALSAPFYISVGIPAEATITPSNQALIRNTIILMLIALVEVGVVLFGGMFFILRPIREMANATRRLSAGDMNVRFDDKRGVGELRHLAYAFNEMAKTLQEHESNLRGAQSQFRLLVEQLPSAVYTARPTTQRTITYISPRIATILGVDAEQCLNIDWNNVIHPEDQGWVSQAVETSITYGSPLHIEYRMKHWDGHYTWVRDDAMIIYDSDHRPISVQGTLHDISERKRDAEIIQVQEETLRELSTPLLNIADRIVLMPIVGALDSGRAQQMMENLLEGVEYHQAKVVILDITGVSIVDTQVANAFIQAAHSITLLGAQIILTGIRPEVAQAIVGLGIDLETIKTQNSLQNGIAYAMNQLRR
jgi:rsbT co-antagonist protein RsbR